MIKMNINDYLRKIKRGPQVILPKDVAVIIAETGLNGDWKVVDAGTGSGFLALILGNLGCKIYTYEIREDFYKIAKENIKNSGMENIEIHNKDITKGIKEKDVDLVTLDMKNPEKAIPAAYNALKKGGFIAVYSMHVEEMKKVINELSKIGFGNIKSVEPMQIEWQSFGECTRPKSWALGHTGFITIARKR